MCICCLSPSWIKKCIWDFVSIDSQPLQLSQPAGCANEICHLRILLSLQSIPVRVCLFSLSVGFSTVYIMLNCGHFQTFPRSSLPCQTITPCRSVSHVNTHGKQELTFLWKSAWSVQDDRREMRPIWDSCEEEDEDISGEAVKQARCREFDRWCLKQ